MTTLGPFIDSPTINNILRFRPYFSSNFQVGGFFLTYDDDERDYVSRVNLDVALVYILFLDTLTATQTSKRSLIGDHIHIFRVIERAAKYLLYVDGKACVLRMICEIQQHELRRSFWGGIIAFILSPQDGGRLLPKEYQLAQQLGQREQPDCHAHYAKCPVSFLQLIMLAIVRTDVAPT